MDSIACEKIARAVQQWVDSFVVGMNLCPFAKRELVKNRVRFFVSDAVTVEQLLVSLQSELDLLNHDQSVATTLLIHPNVLQDFYDYNQFLDVADALLVQMHLEGVYQIASFHPHYQYAGTLPEDAENYINRSPYPMLHLLREASIEQVLEGFVDVDQIPERNIEQMKRLGREKLQALMHHCFSYDEQSR